MDVYWIEQAQRQLPSDLSWLSERELAHLSSLHFAKRRADWLLGRWTGKLAVAVHLGISLKFGSFQDIEIVAAPSGAPEVFVDGKLLDLMISLSHSGEMAACALSNSARMLGCDLEQIEPRANAFLGDYFTAEEQALVACAPTAQRPRLITLMWSAKESALKALRAGLRFDTRCVKVVPDSDGEIADPTPARNDSGNWHALQVSYVGSQTLRGWWRESGNLVQTLVADPTPSLPVELASCRENYA